MVRLLSRVIGIGIETADMLVREILSRKLRDRRAVARYAGLTGSPDESGLKSREKGLAKAGNARVRRGLIQLAWRFLMFQKDRALARWYRTRTEGPSGARKTTMIAALARKLLIALWRLVTTGEVPDGVEFLLHGQDPIWVQPNTSVVRARLLVDQWQAPLGSSRSKPPEHGAAPAVLALVKEKPL